MAKAARTNSPANATLEGAERQTGRAGGRAAGTDASAAG